MVLRPNYYFRSFTVLAVAAAGLLMLLITARPAHAATFTVNSTGDQGDFIPGGACDVNPIASGDQCTLRAAIEDSNATSGADVINFDIPSTDSGCNSQTKVCTIRPGADGLPAITEAVIINGYSQPTASENNSAIGTNAVPLIELDGTNTAGSSAPVNGLTINAGLNGNISNAEIKGLVINRFSGEGIHLVAASGANNKVEGNFIGTDPSGTTDLGNASAGVVVLSGNNTEVGGATKAARNLISGNGDASNNNAPGVSVRALHKVEGNLIGTQKDGTSALGNTGRGVVIAIFSNNTVGGTDPLSGNIIAHNGQGGVGVTGASSIGNRILSNSIFSNGGGLGIDLNLDGCTDNDPKDADTGPNNLQNFPTITSATSTTIKGTLKSLKRKTFTIQFFDTPSGEDEGKSFIGQKTVKTNRKGKASFSFTPTRPLTAGDNVTATATNEATGDTSEFSDPVAVT